MDIQSLISNQTLLGFGCILLSTFSAWSLYKWLKDPNRPTMLHPYGLTYFTVAVLSLILGVLFLLGYFKKEVDDPNFPNPVIHIEKSK